MIDTANATIGQRVKAYRKSRGLSQNELADGICSQATVSHLEVDRVVPSAEIMQKIAYRLGVSLYEIIPNEQYSFFDVKLKLDIIKIYVETGNYGKAIESIDEMEQQSDIAEHQKRDLFIQNAECLIKTGKAKQAIEILITLIRSLEEDKETDNKLLAFVYNKLGNAYFFSSNKTYAHAQYLRAYQLCSRFMEIDLLYAQVHYNLGLTCGWLGFYSDALSYLTVAHDFFSKASDSTKLAQTLFAIGMSHIHMNDQETAEPYIKQSLAIYESNNVIKMAQRAKQQYAALILAKQQPAEAIVELQSTAKEFIKYGDIPRLAYTYALIAKIYLDQNNIEEARKHVELADRLATDELINSDHQFAYVYQVKAKCYLVLNKFEDSIRFSMKSSELFDKIGLLKEAAESLNLSANAYKIQGMFEHACEIQDKVVDYLSRFQEKKFI